MTPGVPKIVDDMRRGRVHSVTDEGEVLLLMPDGKRRTVNIPLETVPLVRRLAALDREIDQDRRRAPEH
jgi:hypothetical protein